LDTGELPVRQAIGYLRVSTASQVRDGISLEAQEERIRAWCAREGVPLTGVYSDAGVSGRRDDRPGLRAALEACKRGDTLVVYALSRLGRSTRHTLDTVSQLNARGVEFLSLSESFDGNRASGRLMLGVLALLGQFEAELIGERTSLALQHLKAQGRYTGGWLPFGYSLGENQILIPIPGEQEILDLARRLRWAGHSLRTISTLLADRGMRSRNGAAFAASQVARMLSPKQESA
jgi:DNA invertase Pin-like site-specific DNA recombinase